MASDSVLESPIPEIESEASLPSQPSSKHQSRYHKFCRPALKGEERDTKGKLLYYYNQCEYKTVATSNFQYHYKVKHKITIESEGRELHMKRADKELQSVIN